MVNQGRTTAHAYVCVYDTVCVCKRKNLNDEKQVKKYNLVGNSIIIIIIMSAINHHL